MFTPEVRLAVGVAAALALGGRPVLAQPAQPPNGRFALVAVDGRRLPARVLEVPTRDGRGTGCFMEVPDGWLTLDLARGTFSMGARKRDTCGLTSFGGDTSATGRYAWDGRRARLTVQPGDAAAEEFPTRLVRGALEVYDTYTHTWYRYRRAPGGMPPGVRPARSHAPPNGALQLSGLRGRFSAPLPCVPPRSPLTPRAHG